MRKVISASQVLSARTSDTGDGVRLALLDEAGEEAVVTLPLDQLSILSAWLEQAGRLAQADPAASPPPPSPPAMMVERWTIRPEADEEHITLGFRMAKGGEIALRMHRAGASAYVKALGSLLGRLLPSPPTRSKH